MNSTTSLPGLLDAVAGIASTLDQQAAASARLARLSDASIGALQTAGLLRLKTPVLFGGHEADPLTELETIEACSRANGSAGWCLGILSGNNGMAAAFLPRDAAAEMFAGGDVAVAGVPGPGGTASPCAGGHEVSGRWSFGSGIHHADWVVAGAVVDGAAPPDGLRVFVLPRSGVAVTDNWQVAGLEASGSCDYAVDRQFVPARMSYGLTDIIGGRVRTGGAAYRLGVPGFNMALHLGVPLGIARRALDEIARQARGKNRGMLSFTRLADRDVFQSDLGRTEIELAAARALAFAELTQAWETAQTGTVPNSAIQARLRAAAVHVNRVARQVTSAAFHAAGGGALFESNPLQRCFRDVQAVGQHFFVSESAFQAYGRIRLGFFGVNPMM